MHGDVDFGLGIFSAIVLRQTAQIQPQIKDYNANTDGLFESLLLAMSDLHLVLNHTHVLHGDFVAQAGHRLHLLDRVSDLVRSVLEL